MFSPSQNAISLTVAGTAAVNVLPGGRVGIGTGVPQAALDVAVLGSASAILVPRDTLANRPGGLNGMIRYDTGTSVFEFFQNNAWVTYGTGAGLGTLTSVAAGVGLTGGPITTSGTLNVNVGTGASQIVQETSASQIAQSSGSAANPSYSFAGNTNSGLFSPSTNTISLSTSGTAAWTVNAAGNLGVGTTTPISPLTVYGTAGTPTLSTSNTTNPSATIFNVESSWGNGLAVGVYGTGAGGYASWLQSSYAGNNAAVAYALILNPLGGNVGIGTTGPQTALDILGNVIIQSNSSTISPRLNFIDLSLGSETSAPDWYIDNNNDSLRVVRRPSLSSADTVAFQVVNSGYVGIGTSGPGAKLHVYGGNEYVTDQPIANYSSSRSSYALYADNFVAASDNGIRIYDGNSLGHLHIGNAGISYLQSYNPNSISPGTLGSSTMDKDDTANFSAITLNPLGGSVGIGTTSPSYVLDVVGDVNSSTALRVAGTQVCTSSGCTSSSDAVLKKNIRPLREALPKIIKLQGVSYDWKDKGKYGNSPQIGLIAQDLEKVFPEVVVTDPVSGLRSVAYDHLVAPLIESVKVLDARLQPIVSRLSKLSGDTQRNENKTDQLERRIEIIRAESVDQKATIDALQRDNLDLRKRLERLERLSGGE